MKQIINPISRCKECPFFDWKQAVSKGQGHCKKVNQLCPVNRIPEWCPLEDFKDLESMAASQHAIWSHWMVYLFKVCHPAQNGALTIPKDKVNRWSRQMNLTYDQLSEQEKESDRQIVRNFFGER